MYRYKFTIEYDGDASEVGWQHQPDKVSIQSILSEAAHNFIQKEVKFHGASRTDKGVNALCQIAHADFTKSYPVTTIKKAMNFHLTQLKHAVAIRKVEFVSEDFSSRFAAKTKVYKYDICIQDYPTVINTKNWRIVNMLDVDAMSEASQFLLGEHDFSSFRDSNCQALSPIRSIDNIKIEMNDNIISVYVVGRSFLHHQVRVIVGTLIDVGKGRRKASDMPDILNAKSRCAAGPTAPPQGLFLMNISFDS